MTIQDQNIGTLADKLAAHTGRFTDKKFDWEAFPSNVGFPELSRAQMRYIGTGATGVTDDENVVPAENFTFSTMVLPAGCEGPLHIHRDAEEVFFILKGHKIRFFIEHKGEMVETVLTERDLVSVPPGVYRGLRNEGIEEALMCVLIGNPKPVTPTYPPDHPVSKIKRDKKPDAA